jgi:hypothetical protein
MFQTVLTWEDLWNEKFFRRLPGGHKRFLNKIEDYYRGKFPMSDGSDPLDRLSLAQNGL